jgi:hypothetical protein
MIKTRFNAIRKTENPVEEDLVIVLSDDFSDQYMNFYAHMMEWLVKARQRIIFI